MQQYHHYQSLHELLVHSPSQESPHLGEIVMFIGQVRRNSAIVFVLPSVIRILVRNGVLSAISLHVFNTR